MGGWSSPEFSLENVQVEGSAKSRDMHGYSKHRFPTIEYLKKRTRTLEEVESHLSLSALRALHDGYAFACPMPHSVMIKLL